MTTPKTLVIVDEAAGLSFGEGSAARIETMFDLQRRYHPPPVAEALVITFGQTPHGTSMDLGDGVVIAADEADRIRDLMDKVSGKIPPEVAQGILTGTAAGAHFNVSTGRWAGPPAPTEPKCIITLGGRRRATGKIIFTHHAIDRFRKRHARHLTSASAAALFKKLVPLGKLLEEKSLQGQDQWLVDEPDQPRFIFLTKDDPKSGIVIVTVLTMEMQAPTSEDLEEFSAAQTRLAPSFGPSVAAPSNARTIRYPVIEYRPLPRPAAPVVVAPVTRPDAHENDQRWREATRAKKTAERTGRAAVVAAAAALTGAPVSMAWARVTRNQLNIARLELEAARARGALRLALRALRPLIATDPRAAATWAAIGAIDPTMITDRFIDTERPVPAKDPR